MFSNYDEDRDLPNVMGTIFLSSIVTVAALFLSLAVSPFFWFLLALIPLIYAFFNSMRLPRTVVILQNPNVATVAAAESMHGPSVAGNGARGQTLMLVPVAQARRSLRSRRSKRKMRKGTY